MKRIIVFPLICIFMLSGALGARADGIDIKVKGTWDFAFGWVNNKGFKDSVNSTAPNHGRPDDDNFAARQRVWTQINFIASEYLQAVLMFEIGDLEWGQAGGGGFTSGRGSGAALDADGVNVETKRAYLDWLIPSTEVSVRMGIQSFKLPSTRMGNMVFDAEAAGIVVSSPITDWLSATAFWLRPFDQYRNSGTWDGNHAEGNFSDAVDVFGLVLPVSIGGWSLSPYFSYAWVGANSGLYDYLFDYSSVNTIASEDSRAKAWWLGTNFELSLFDPLTFGLDVIYGHLSKADLGQTPPGSSGLTSRSWGTEGWYIGAVLDYKLDFMTPGIFGWWASGDKESAVEEGELGRLPVLGVDQGFMATTFGAGGYYSINNGNNSVTVTQTGTGTWGIGIQLADITFIEELSHTLRLAYYRGTNDSDLVRKHGVPFKYAGDALYLTDEDSVWEVNFDHQYKIYENLTAILELGYLHLRSDRNTWGDRGFDESDGAWKAELMFRYRF